MSPARGDLPQEPVPGAAGLALVETGANLKRGFAHLNEPHTVMSTRSAATLLSGSRSLSWDDCRLLIESVVDYAIFMLDVDGRVATWNIGAERIKGYGANEIIGEHFSKFYTREDIEAGKPEAELVTATKFGRVEDEGWKLRKDGTRFWASVIITALRDGAGDLRGFAKVTRDLTQRKNLEEALRTSEERFRLLVDGVVEYAIYMLDPEGRVTTWNAGAERMKGYRADEILGKNFAVFFPKADAEAGKPALELQIARSQGRFEDEGWRVRKDGSRFWANVVVSPLWTSQGVFMGFAKVTRDLTKRREAEEIERRLIAEKAARTAERREEARAKCLSEATAALATSLDPERMLSAFASVLVPGLADWCSIDVVDGGDMHNVTVAHTNEEALRDAREYVRKHRPRLSDSRGIENVLLTGRSKIYNDITNETVEQITQDAPHLRAFGAGLQAAIVAPIQVRASVTGAISLGSTQAGRCFDEHDVRLLEELGRRAGVAMDNAQLYRATHEAAKKAEAAAKAAADANRIKDEFLATVSHELRTPLSAIVGWAAILRQRDLEPTIAKAVEVIDRNAQAQVRIVEDILDVSRIITGKLRLEPKPIDVVALTRDAIEVVRPSASAKEISLEFAPFAEVCLLVGDPERIRQVVWNLLSNAVKFTDSRGSIRVTIAQQASNISLVVADTGRGIESDLLPFVFDRFRQGDASTTRRFGGLGLGLALVRHIVELHGGSVAAESAGPAKGAVFTVTLPIRAVAPAAHPERTLSSTDVVGFQHVRDALRGIRVLVVDDDLDARELVTAVLSAAGAVVHAAASAHDAFDAIPQFRPEILVSDIGMAEEDGYALIRRVRKLRTDEGGGIPSIALTAYTRNEDRTKALAAGFTTHVGKPVNPDDLVAAVANLAVFARS